MIRRPPRSTLLSLHDALPISCSRESAVSAAGNASLRWASQSRRSRAYPSDGGRGEPSDRSEEHTSELQSRLHLVCRLLLEKKKREPTPCHAGHTTDSNGHQTH